MRRNERHRARTEKEEAKHESAKQRESLQEAVDAAKEEGFPTGGEEKEAYFLDQVSAGEALATDRKLMDRYCHCFKDRLG